LKPYTHPRFFLLICLIMASGMRIAVAQQKSTPPAVKHSPASPDSLLIEHILRRQPEKFKKLLDNPGKYKIQIIYTQVNRDKNNVPSLHEYKYGVDPNNYFYPASLVKLPCSALALEKIRELNIDGLNRESEMFTDSVASCQKRVRTDSTAANGYPSLAQYIRRMLLISDNFAYGRTYEFLSPAYIHTKLTEKGYPNAFIIHRFDSDCGPTDNACTNPIDFYDSNGKLLYHRKEENCTNMPLNPIGNPQAGQAYIDGKGVKVNAPKDFSKANYLALPDITHMLGSIVFPNAFPENQRFAISEGDRMFLLRYLSMIPRESDHPHYPEKEYNDSYKKYLIYGDNKKHIAQDSVRIFNIVGQSYGFVEDVAYVCDFKNKVEFMLSAVIYTNADEVINDNKYEYTTIAMPFMANLGKAIYNYDRRRKRSFRPDLSGFRFSYQ
jgi:hypothetical protein